MVLLQEGIFRKGLREPQICFEVFVFFLFAFFEVTLRSLELTDCMTELFSAPTAAPGLPSSSCDRQSPTSHQTNSWFCSMKGHVMCSEGSETVGSRSSI